jgi:hypothetical protein
MEVKDKFKLSHVALYAKGFYIRTDNVIEDLIEILKLDNYTPFDKKDVLNILMKAYQKCFEVDLINFISDIQDGNTWKVGYITKNCPFYKNAVIKEYDMLEACIYKMLSDVRFLTKEQFVIEFPKYSKKNPRPQNIEIKELYHLFGRHESRIK